MFPFGAALSVLSLSYRNTIVSRCEASAFCLRVDKDGTRPFATAEAGKYCGQSALRSCSFGANPGFSPLHPNRGKLSSLTDNSQTAARIDLRSVAESIGGPCHAYACLVHHRRHPMDRSHDRRIARALCENCKQSAEYALADGTMARILGAGRHST